MVCRQQILSIQIAKIPVSGSNHLQKYLINPCPKTYPEKTVKKIQTLSCVVVNLHNPILKTVSLIKHLLEVIEHTEINQQKNTRDKTKK